MNPPPKSIARPLDLDSLDTQLLALLETDGRMSVSSLARKVGRSRSAIQERLQRLENAGYIGGYTIRRGGPAVGVRAFLLISGTAGDHEEIAAALRKFPEVRRCDSVSGAVDIVVQVQAPDIGAVERVCKAVGALRGVERTVTLFVMDARIHRP